MSFPDLGPYVKKVRMSRGLTTYGAMERAIDISYTELNRSENGDMDSSDLSDILKLERFINDDGLFWEICWKSAVFLAHLDTLISQELGRVPEARKREIRRLAYSTIALARWKWIATRDGRLASLQNP